MCGEGVKRKKPKGSTKGEDRILWTDKGPEKKKRGSHLRILFVFGLILLLSVGGSLFYVWTRIQVIQIGYEISTALKENKALTEANKRMRLEVGSLKSFARIERIAVEELKMVKPRPDQVIVIR